MFSIYEVSITYRRNEIEDGGFQRRVSFTEHQASLAGAEQAIHRVAINPDSELISAKIKLIQVVE